MCIVIGLSYRSIRVKVASSERLSVLDRVHRLVLDSEHALQKAAGGVEK
jgi:hypothetical protein